MWFCLSTGEWLIEFYSDLLLGLSETATAMLNIWHCTHLSQSCTFYVQVFVIKWCFLKKKKKKLRTEADHDADSLTAECKHAQVSQNTGYQKMVVWSQGYSGPLIICSQSSIIIFLCVCSLIRRLGPFMRTPPYPHTLTLLSCPCPNASVEDSIRTNVLWGRHLCSIQTSK